ncbi:MAG TPA: hypothetical protein VGB70_12805 [Allosphingosinicella sp.]|jgi:hypothetical protein
MIGRGLSLSSVAGRRVAAAAAALGGELWAQPGLDASAGLLLQSATVANGVVKLTYNGSGSALSLVRCTSPEGIAAGDTLRVTIDVPLFVGPAPIAVRNGSSTSPPMLSVTAAGQFSVDFIATGSSSFFWITSGTANSEGPNGSEVTALSIRKVLG